MQIKEMAPWISLVITFVMAILVPFLTQLSNNRFQMKKYKMESSSSKEKDKRMVYAHFVEKSGLIGTTLDRDAMHELLTSITNLYVYAPQEWWQDIDELFTLCQEFDWEKATPIMLGLCKKISFELNKDLKK